ncbi:PucR family transcriptional regulator [Streptomyces sp. NBC_01262]|uniref:PucR family transcriptional regulator n=1 Tax=Streptomyces sp. NBC_01262 TaxID=2903803 RepID=UPI002E2FAAAB|nr:helix-turn-helix domain-containing protein [Streptomyces sp. NBC_01262]
MQPRLAPGFASTSTSTSTSAWAAFGIQTIGRIGHVLDAAPAEDPQRALWLALKIRESRGDQVRVAVAWRPGEDLDGAVREVEDVLKAVSALKRGPGVYRLDDVAVECAVANSPEVSRHLAKLIVPVVTQPDLLKTLEALIAADGNRARAACELIIHRSTIDYRLRRIEYLTGHSPTQVRGLQTLCSALAAYAMLRVPEYAGARGSAGAEA